MLEVRRAAAVGAHHGPPVRHRTSHRLPDVNHWFNRDRQSWLQANSSLGFSVVRYLRIFVEADANAVTHQIPYDAESRRLDDALHRGADVADVIFRSRRFDTRA